MPTARPTETFRRGDLVKVPFPYGDPATAQRRPAVVVSNGPMGRGGALLWVIMVTSAEHIGWPGDVRLGDRYAQAGLPAPSVVRTSKIAIVEKSKVEKIGQLPRDIMLVVDQMLLAAVGLQR